MNVSVSREGLWQMLQSLSLNNQKWISDKLTENINAQENEQRISKEEILAGIDAGLKDLKAGGGMDAWEFLKELRDERED